MTPSSDPARSDAKANRQRIIEVARHAFAADGDVPMNAIAKLAGIGQGTLYRHFPTREDLVIAAYREEIDDLANLAPELVKAQQPMIALWAWLERLAQYGKVKYGVAAVIHAVSDQNLDNDAYARVVGAIRLLLDACVTANLVSDAVRADDVLLMLGFLWRIDPSSPDGDERAKRMLHILVAGLLVADRESGDLQTK
jgi:AcrR family transcriptional regulator